MSTTWTDDRGYLRDPSGEEGTEAVPLCDDGLPAAVHLVSADEVAAVNAALATGRALLVRGEPGTGKSQLARAAATMLGRGLAHQAVDARTDTHDLLWRFDAIERLGRAQAVRAGEGDVRGVLDRKQFLQPGALWWALDAASAQERVAEAGCGACAVARPNADQVVALVDEVDKADPSVPNALLDALGHGGFTVHGLPERVARREDTRPLVVITTNDQRTLPAAFLRRCLVLHHEVPDGEGLRSWLVARGAVQPYAVGGDLLADVADRVAKARERLGRVDGRPGLAEYLDLVRALHEQRPDDADEQRALLGKIALFFLEKRPRRGR